MRDFTINQYITLLKALQKQGFLFQPFDEFIETPQKKTAILRHDVDRLPHNSLKTAQIENELGIKGSYYFRIVPNSYNENIIKQIAALGHEIGYHYEDLTLAKGDINKAYDLFCLNFGAMRKLYPVKTICMHGSPMNKYDNRDLWKHYDYKQFGITGEPYFDIDFSKVLYLTDTGRRWDGEKVSIRDKVKSGQLADSSQKFKTTFDIIKAAEKNALPDKVMITVHPQRWNNNAYLWAKELVMQNVKNVVKRFLVK